MDLVRLREYGVEYVQGGRPCGAWELIGTTCWPQDCPRKSSDVTMGMMRSAFSLDPPMILVCVSVP